MVSSVGASFLTYFGSVENCSNGYQVNQAVIDKKVALYVSTKPAAEEIFNMAGPGACEIVISIDYAMFAELLAEGKKPRGPSYVAVGQGISKRNKLVIFEVPIGYVFSAAEVEVFDVFHHVAFIDTGFGSFSFFNADREFVMSSAIATRAVKDRLVDYLPMKVCPADGF